MEHNASSGASAASSGAEQYVDVVIINRKKPGPYELLLTPFPMRNNDGQVMLDDDGDEIFDREANKLFFELDEILGGIDNFSTVSRSDPRLVEFVREKGKNIPGLEIQRVEAGLDFCIQNHLDGSEEIMTAYDEWFIDHCPAHQPGEILIVDISYDDDR